MVESNADTLLKGKATQQSNETEANPYNAKKDYIDYEQMNANAKEPFANADTIAVKKDQPKLLLIQCNQQKLRKTLRKNKLTNLIKRLTTKKI